MERSPCSELATGGSGVGWVSEMRARIGTVLTWLSWSLLVIVLLSVLAGQLLGQPFLLTYVETGSMAPTLQPGDAFIAVPAAVGGAVEPGDVIVYRASVIEGGSLTTHRVVGETPEGYITRGDANLVTDQDSGEPPVTEGQILATALSIGDRVIVIPKLGLVAIAARELLDGLTSWLAVTLGRPGLLGAQGSALALFAAGVAAYAIATWVEEDGGRRRYLRTRRRAHVIDVRWLVLGLAVGIALIATASMAVPLGPHEFELVSAENDAPGPRIVEAGTSETLTYVVPGGGLLPTVVVLEPASSGLSVDPKQLYVRGGETVNATVTVTAPPEIGYAPQYLREHRYIAVLPRGLIIWLHGLHPWLPILAIDTLLGGGFALLGLAWLGGGQLRVRQRAERLSTLSRLRRRWL